MAPRKDPLGNYNFFVRLLDAANALVGAVGAIAGAHVTADAGFSEVRGLEGSMQVQDYPEGGANAFERRFPGRIAWSNLTLQRGVAINRNLWDWFHSYAEGTGLRRDGLVMLLNDERDPVAVWKFKRGIPVKWTGPSLSGHGNEVAIETIEIAHEGIELQAGPGL